MSGISIHVVDVVSGRPARGMRVEVFREAEGQRRELATGTIDADGLLQHPIVHGESVTTGAYVVAMHAGEYFRAQELDVGQPAFQEVALFRFVIGDATQHYHLPVKLSPWGLSIWRGR
jgi:5-hydroxyisourate hydrolase